MVAIIPLTAPSCILIIESGYKNKRLMNKSFKQCFLWSTIVYTTYQKPPTDCTGKCCYSKNHAFLQIALHAFNNTIFSLILLVTV